jgi:hypothetical protein
VDALRLWRWSVNYHLLFYPDWGFDRSFISCVRTICFMTTDRRKVCVPDGFQIQGTGAEIFIRNGGTSSLSFRVRYSHLLDEI